MWSRFSEQSKRIVFYSQEAARVHGNTDVTSEHLLAGLLQEVLTRPATKTDKTIWPPAPTNRLTPQNAAALLLRQSIADLEKLQSEVQASIAGLNIAPTEDADRRRLASSAKQTTDRMIKEAMRVHAKEFGAEFLVLALSQDIVGSVGKLLAQAGFDTETARQKVAILHLPVKENKLVKPSLLTNLAKRFFAKPKDTI
ncbi:MAG: Clp protease N-terminal domain-containing protein [Janthinobacterium lividum]